MYNGTLNFNRCAWSTGASAIMVHVLYLPDIALCDVSDLAVFVCV